MRAADQRTSQGFGEYSMASDSVANIDAKVGLSLSISILTWYFDTVFQELHDQEFHLATKVYVAHYSYPVHLYR